MFNNEGTRSTCMKGEEVIVEVSVYKYKLNLRLKNFKLQ